MYEKGPLKKLTSRLNLRKLDTDYIQMNSRA